MVERTEKAEHLWCLDLAARVGARLNDEKLPALLLEMLSERLQCDFACFNQGGDHPPIVRVGDHTPAPDVQEHLAALRLLQVHPLWREVLGASTRTPAAPARIPDAAAAQRWRDHPVDRDVLSRLGLAPHTVLVVVAAGQLPDVAWYTFNREHDFTDQEIELLTRVQPMLAIVEGTRERARRSVVAPVSAAAPSGRLTAREQEVVRHLAHGLTTASIARRLGISKRTADKHLEHVHAKLNTAGPVATLAEAHRRGML